MGGTRKLDRNLRIIYRLQNKQLRICINDIRK